MALALGTNVGFVLVSPTADPAGTNTTIDGSSVVVKDTSPAEATKITEIGWYRGAGTNSANFEVALYSDLAGVPVTRLFVDATNSSTSGGWITVAVDWAISGSTPYWLAVQMDAHSGSSSIDTATSGGSGTDVLTSQTTLNDPYGGGTVADADGMYAIYAKVNVNQIVLPGVGAATFTGFAPTINLHKNINAGLGQAVFTGFAPTWSSEASGSSVNALPGTGVATLNGFAPTVQTPRNVTPGTGQATLAGLAPTVQTPRNITPGVGQGTFTGFAPTVSVGGGSANTLPGTGQTLFTGFAPTISLASVVTVGRIDSPKKISFVFDKERAPGKFGGRRRHYKKFL